MLDVTQEFPKPLTDIVVQAADFVITMGCGDACPVYPGKRMRIGTFPTRWAADRGRRDIRNEIEVQVKALLEKPSG